MGHYLQLLAARAVGAATLARPHLPSLFGGEPVAPIDGAPAFEPIAPSTGPAAASAFLHADAPAAARGPGVAPPRVVSPTPVRMPVGENAARTALPVEPSQPAVVGLGTHAARTAASRAGPNAVGPDEAPAPAPIPSGHRPIAVPSAPAAASRREEEIADLPPGARRSAQRPPSAGSAWPDEDRASPAAARRVAVAADDGGPAIRPWAVRADTAGRDFTEASRRPAIELPPSPSARTHPAPVRTMSQSAGPRTPFAAASTRPAPSPVPPASAAMPTIQVSIGRLEVRTASTPAPPASLPGRTRQAPTGLDHYLQRRARGGTGA